MNMATSFVERYRYQTLYFLFLSAYLFVFMPMLFRFGYHWDETLDFDGTATDTYLANGRWMQALLRYLLGEGVHPWTTSFLACMILPYATVLQCKLYQWEDILHDVIFGCLTIVMYQYAFVMQYSHQSDVTAIGMLLMTFSAILLTDKGWSFKTVLALITTFTALSIYQTTGLYLAAILLVWGIIQCFKGNTASAFRIVLKVLAIMVLAAALCEVGSRLAKTFVDEETRLYCTLAHERIGNTAGLLVAPLGYIAHYALCTAKHCIKPEFKLEWMYGCTLAALALIVAGAFRFAPGKFFTKIAIATSAVALWMLPFALILLLGNEWPCKPHTRLAEPLAFAGLWSLALRFSPFGHPFSPCARRICAILLSVLLIKASACVSDIAKVERALFENRMYNLKQMEREACQVAEQAGLDIDKCRFIYFENGSDDQYGNEDFNGAYPAWEKIPTARNADYAKHKETIQQMPIWPRNGSIRADKGEVIIKGASYGGTQEMNYL